MKTKFKKVIIASVAALCLTISPFAAIAAGEGTVSPKVISVSAQGLIKVNPDIAYINLGVTTEHKDAKEAQANNARLMEKVIKAITDAGIAREDIKTTNYSIYPKYYYPKIDPLIKEPQPSEPQIIGYTVNNSFQVTVRDIQKTGTVIDIATSQGVNVTNGISFGLSDYDKYYYEALKFAVKNAETKANIIASALGITLTVPASVSESGGYYYEPKTYNFDSSIARMEGISATPISEGTMEVRANVSMTYHY